MLLRKKGVPIISERAKELGFMTSMDPIQPGDLYLAERNSGPHLLTCYKANEEEGWIVPVERAYCFDTNECIKIVEV